MNDEKQRVIITGPKGPRLDPPSRGGPLADEQIQERMRLPEGDPRRLVIEPYDPGTSLAGRVSSGLSSYGYDLRLGTKFRIFSNVGGCVIDVRDFKEEALLFHEGPSCLIPPNAFALAEVMEWMEVPEDVLGVVLNKSTYCRVGIGLTMSPAEPGWKGRLTVEIANHTPLPARVWSGDGIGQIVFLEGSRPCQTPYNKKRNPRYQNQPGLTLASVTGPKL